MQKKKFFFYYTCIIIKPWLFFIRVTQQYCIFIQLMPNKALWLFEYAANSAVGERLRREGETSCSRGETGDIILLNEIKGLSKMSLVSMCFVLQKSL